MWRRPRHETTGEAAKEIDAGEALPLVVGLEQLRSLVGLDPPAVKRLAELEEAEVADQPTLVAAESLQRDDAYRPRSEPALALEAARRVAGRACTRLDRIARATTGAGTGRKP